MASAEEILARPLWAYRLLRWLIRIATDVFFHRIEISGKGNVPGGGAVIFCGNHPNSLLDPVLITAYSGRVVHFAAKDTLWKNPVLRPFLSIAGSVPVRRRMDHEGKSVDNSAMFETMYEVLAAGRATGIFPEGISHDQSQLAPLKSGAARMAFGLVERHPDVKLSVVPTGLVYFNRHRFRSNALIQFGMPIVVDDKWRDRYREDASAAIKTLTETIDSRIRTLTVNAEDWNQAWILDGVRRLYQPPNTSFEERVRVARRFNLAYPQVKDQREVQTLYARVGAYLMRASALGLDDETLRGDRSLGSLAMSVVRNLVLFGVYYPLFIAGALVHVPLGLALKAAGRLFAPRSDVVATTKFLLGLLSILVVYSVVVGVAAWNFGAWAGAVQAALLLASGWATVKILGRLYALRRLMAVGLRRATLRREIEDLRAERAALVGEVVATVERYRHLADRAEAELHGAGS